MNRHNRRDVPPATRVDIDDSNRVWVPHRGPAYALPLRASWAKSDDMVLDLDPARLLVAAGGTAGSAVNSLVLVGGLGLLSGAITCIWTTVSAWGQDTFFVILSTGFALAFLWGTIACYREPSKHPITWPTIFNRRTGTVIQMQGKERVEARWDDLLPHIEILNAGGGISCNLALLHLMEDGRRARSYIQVQRALGFYDSLAVYEFVARYMEGDWDGLPEIRVMPGVRPGFWDAYRHGFWNPWIGAVDWEKRDALSRARMFLWVPIWTILMLPLVILTMVGSRMGWEPRFSDEDLEAARYVPERDGPTPEVLNEKLQLPGPMHPTERCLLTGVWVVASTLWLLGIALILL